ncbi:MAG: hypothetical protein KGM47_06730 [Acidobacteriota bacterium]|nr:hypothetical protein [Acidobacteriota bacterium]
MGDSFRALGLLFVRSIPTIFFVIILLAILDRLFFRPMAKMMKKRAEETTGAIARAREQINDAETKSRKYESEVQAARAKLYASRQAEHAGALARHEAALREAREHSERLVKEAQAAIAAEMATVKSQLSASCQALASEITDRILGGGATN